MNDCDYEKEKYRLPIITREDLKLLVIGEIQFKTRYIFLPIRLVQMKRVSIQCLISVWGERPFLRPSLCSHHHLKEYVLDPEISILGIFPVGILSMWVNTQIHTYVHMHTQSFDLNRKKGKKRYPNVYHLENINSSTSVFWTRQPP